MAMRNDLSAEVKSDLVNFNSAVDGQGYLCFGNTVRGDSPVRIYYYDSVSTATADGESILAATAMGGVGRFIKKSVESTGKRQETYTGTTAGSGTYTVTYGTAYPATPNIQFNINGGTTTNTARLTASSTTGFTITTNNRVEVLGLLPTYPTINGLVVDVLVTEK